MMRCSDLPWLIQFIVMFYNDKPGDWLLDGMMETKACNLEKDLVSNYLWKACIVRIYVLERNVTYNRHFKFVSDLELVYVSYNIDHSIITFEFYKI